MAQNPVPRSPESETGRETRLKLILLALALILVVGYAAMVTSMGDVVLRQAVAVVHSKAVLLWGAAALAAVVLGGSAFVYLRRYLPRIGRSSAENAAPIKLADRKEFLAALAHQLETHGKSGRQVAVHVVDIDRFRMVNEVLGEAEGDAFLKLVTERLMILVNHPERLGRIGDDEFALIQPEAGGMRHAEIFARRIQDTLKDACAHVPRHARPGASIGIGLSPDHGKDAAKLLQSASLALRSAKQAGGDTFRVYQREMNLSVEARLQMEKAVSDGLHKGWFELHFQPQYDLQSRRLTGFEALVRMNHPELGELLPAAFLPAAEESGLMQPLGEWIIRDALAIAADWPAHLTLAINISLVQFRYGDVANTILQALSNTGFDGARLRVEFSEAVLLEQSDAVDDQLRRLKGRGVTIVLDDFGVDISRLQSLSRSACDAVKLDRSLIERVGQEPEMENVVRSLIGTAHAFDLDILAEGIERAEQAHFLMSNDCQKLQGYLFGRPTPAHELAAVVAKDMRNAVGGDDEAAPEATAAA